jgi:CRISPR type III-A-associated protein Csm2
MVRKAEEIGRRLREPLRAAQLRSIYAALRLIETEWQGDNARAAGFLMEPVDSGASGAAAENLDVSQRLTHLRPKIAYLAAKHQASIGPLRPVLEMSIGRVESDGARLVRLVDFVTAILAYHRAAGGEVKAAPS